VLKEKLTETVIVENIMQTPSAKNKSKRVQKKLYLGDYAVLGFEVSGQFILGDDSELDSFFDNFMAVIESNNLCFGGGYSKQGFDGFITSIERYNSTTEDDHNTIKSWLSSQTNISHVEVGDLVDANYGI
jgi:uncharacterized protein